MEGPDPALVHAVERGLDCSNLLAYVGRELHVGTKAPIALPQGLTFSTSQINAMSNRVESLGTLASAGLREADDTRLPNTLARLLETLALSSTFADAAQPNGLPPHLATHATMFSALDALVREERRRGQLPLVHPRLVLPSDAMSRSNELVLGTLSSLIRVADYRNPGPLEEPLSALADILSEFEALSFFDDWVPARVPPEVAADVAPDTAAVGSTAGSANAAANALADDTTTWMSSRGISSEISFDVDLVAAATLSSVRVAWAKDVVPSTVSVWVHSGDVAVERAWVKVASCPAGTTGVTHMSLNMVSATAVRVTMVGFAPTNAARCYGIRRLEVFAPNPAAMHTPTLGLLEDLQVWLERVSGAHPHLRDAALAASLSLAMSSGSQAALLRYGLQLLGDMGDVQAALAAPHAATVKAALRTIKEAEPDADERYLSLCASGGDVANTMSAAFDPELGSSTSGQIELSNENRTVRSTTGNNTLAVVGVGFTTGQATWEFTLDDDSNGGECSCFGAVHTPVSDMSYSGSSSYMYRAYNGQLYGSGKRGLGNRQKIHPGNHVVVSLDMDAGTMSFSVDGVDQGICFEGLSGKTIHPAVGFYSSGRTISLVNVVQVGAPPPVVALARALSAEEEAGPTKPAPPVLAPADDEAAANAAHGEALTMLCSMGFHWHAAAQALASAGGNAQAAADELLSSDSSAVVAEHEARVKAHAAAAASYDDALAKYEADLRAFEEAKDAKAAAAGAGDGAESATAAAGGFRPLASPATRLEAVCSLVGRLDRLAERYNPEADFKPAAPPAEDGEAPAEDLPRPKPTAVTDASEAIDLAVPYALQAHGSTFSALHALLEAFLPHVTAPTGGLTPETATAMVTALLRLLRANMERLVLARAPLSAAGVMDAAQLQPLTATLHAMTQPDSGLPEALQMDAASTLSSGMEVLYATPELRAELLSSLIVRQRDGGLPPGSARLLGHCLQRFSTPAGVVSLLPATLVSLTASTTDGDDLAAAAASSAQRVSDLLVTLFDVLQGETLAALERDPGAPGPAAGSDLVTAGGALLGALQRHVFCLAREELASLPAAAPATGDGFDSAAWEHRLGGAEWSPAPLTIPAVHVLIAYGRLVTGQAHAVVTAASARAKSKRKDKLPLLGHVASVVSASVVGRLLPAFTAGVALMASQAWLASTLLPSLTKICVDLDALNGALAPVTAVSPALDLPENRAPALTDDQKKKAPDGSELLLRTVPDLAASVAGYSGGAHCDKCSKGSSSAGIRAFWHSGEGSSGYDLCPECYYEGVPRPPELFSGFVTVCGRAVDAFTYLGFADDAGEPKRKTVTGNGTTRLGSFTVAGTQTGAAVKLTLTFDASTESKADDGGAESKTDADAAPQAPLTLVGTLDDGRLFGSCAAEGAALAELGFGLASGGEAKPSPARPTWHVELQHSLAAVCGQLVNAMVRGPHVSYEEEELAPWLESRLLAGGIGAMDAVGDLWQPGSVFGLGWEGEDAPPPPAAGPSPGADLDPELVWVQAVLAAGPEDASAAGAVLLRWLNSKTPESRLKRRKGVFPELELTMLLAVCRHAGLVGEAEAAATSLANGTSTDGDLSPSEDLLAAWKAVVRVRAFVRDQKSAMRGHGEGEEGEAKEEEEAAAVDEATSRKLKPDLPKDFPTLRAAVLARAQFLLDLVPAAAAALPTATPGLSKLQESWTSMLPPKAMQPLTRSWKSAADSSMDGADHRWGGMIKVLARQRSWQRQHSFSSTGGQSPLEDAESDADENDIVSNLDRKLSPAERAMRQAASYVNTGVTAPPALLMQLLRWRCRRARARAFGLRAMEVLMQRLLSADAKATALVWLRPALAVSTEREAAGAPPPAATSAPWTLRHHYMASLGGCPHAVLDRVQAAFVQLFTQLADTLSMASTIGNQRLAAAVMWTWGCDVEPRDHEFMLRVNVLPILHDLMSVARGPEDRAAAGAPAADGAWQPWDLAATRRGLVAGWLSKRQVVSHLQAAPSPPAAVAGKPPAAAAAAMSVEEVLLAVAASAPSPQTDAWSDAVDDVPLSQLALSGAGSSVTVDVSRRVPLVRFSVRHEEHEYDLVRDVSRARHSTCDLCGADCNSNGIASWMDGPRDFDVCEVCFRMRETAEEWESPPVDEPVVLDAADLEPELTAFAPEFGRRVYVDSDNLTLDAVPAELSHDRLCMVRTMGALASGDGPSFSMDVRRPCRVHLAFRDGVPVPAWVPAAYSRTGLTVTVQGNMSPSLLYHVYVSNEVYEPAATGASGVPSSIVLRGLPPAPVGAGFLPGSSELRNYLVFLEELTAEEYVRRPAGPGGVAGDGLTLPPIPHMAWLRGGAWSLFRVLVTLGVGARSSTGDDDDSSTPAPGGSDAVAAAAPGDGSPPSTLRFSLDLHKMAFNIVTAELRLGALALGDTEGAGDLEAVEVEALLHSQLQFLLLVSATQPAKLYLASPEMLKWLTIIFSVGSPRLQRVVLRILRAVATRLEPPAMDHVVRTAWPAPVVHRWTEVAGGKSPFVGLLLELASRPVAASTGLAAPPADATGLPSVAGFGTGTVVQGLASEAVALLRTLVGLSGWSPAIVPHLEPAVHEAAALVDGGDSDAATVARVVGSLAVLGGFSEALRVGGRAVAVSGVGGSVRVVQYHPGSGRHGLQVAFTDSLRAAAGPPPGILRPVADVAPPSVLKFGADVVEDLTRVITAGHGVTGAAGGRVAPPAWQSRLATMCLSILSTALHGEAAATAALNSGLLDLLYGVALTPSPAEAFETTAGLERRLASLEARLVEAATPGTTALLPAAALDHVGTVALAPRPGSAAALSESKDDAPESESKTADGTAAAVGHSAAVRALATDAGCTVTTAAGALLMADGDRAAAAAWLAGEEGARWATPAPWGTFVGIVGDVSVSAAVAPPSDASDVSVLVTRGPVGDAAVRTVERAKGAYDADTRVLKVTSTGGSRWVYEFTFDAVGAAAGVKVTPGGDVEALTGSLVLDLGTAAGEVAVSDDACLQDLGKTASLADEMDNKKQEKEALGEKEDDAAVAAPLYELTPLGLVASAAKAGPGGAAAGAGGAGNEARYRFKIDNIGGSYMVCVGVARETISPDKYLGQSSSGWGVLHDGRKGTGESYVSYGGTFSTGDTVTVSLKAGELRFSINGADQGVAFTGVPNDVMPAVTLSNPGDVVTLVESWPVSYQFSAGEAMSSFVKLHPSATAASSTSVTCTASTASGASAVAVMGRSIAVPPRLAQFNTLYFAQEPPSAVAREIKSKGFGDDDVLAFLRACEAQDDDVAAKAEKVAVGDEVPLSRLAAGAGAGMASADGVTFRDKPVDATTGVTLVSPGAGDKGGSAATFELRRRHGVLDFQVGLADSVGPAGTVLDPPVVVEVHGDGATLWTSPPLAEPRQLHTCSVAVFTVSDVRVVTRRVGPEVDAATPATTTDGPAVVLVGAAAAGRGVGSLETGFLVAIQPPKTGKPSADLDCLESVTVGQVMAAGVGQGDGTARVRLVDIETGVATFRDVPVGRLCAVTAVYGVDVASVDAVRQLVAATHLSMASAQARACLQAILSAWPSGVEYTADAVGGADRLLGLTKLVAASGLTGGAGGASEDLETLRGAVKRLLGAGEKAADALSAALIRDCISHFVGSTAPQAPAAVRESLHPHPSTCDFGGVVKVPGVNKVVVEVDKETKVAPGARLRVFAGEGPSRKLVREIADSPDLSAVTVRGDTVSWDFVAIGDTAPSGAVAAAGQSACWGFRVRVCKVLGSWACEADVAEEPSLDWACWLLEFLLNDAGNALRPGAIHNAAMYDALVQYIRTVSAPVAVRARVVMLLAQLLSAPAMFPVDAQPDLATLLPLQRQVMSKVKGVRSASSASTMLPKRLLDLTQLMIFRQAAEVAFAAAVEASPSAVAASVLVQVSRPAGAAHEVSASDWPAALDFAAVYRQFADAYGEDAFKPHKMETRLDELRHIMPPTTKLYMTRAEAEALDGSDRMPDEMVDLIFPHQPVFDVYDFLFMHYLRKTYDSMPAYMSQLMMEHCRATGRPVPSFASPSEEVVAPPPRCLVSRPFTSCEPSAWMFPGSEPSEAPVVPGSDVSISVVRPLTDGDGHTGKLVAMADWAALARSLPLVVLPPTAAPGKLGADVAAACVIAPSPTVSHAVVQDAIRRGARVVLVTEAAAGIMSGISGGFVASLPADAMVALEGLLTKRAALKKRMSSRGSLAALVEPEAAGAAGAPAAAGAASGTSGGLSISALASTPVLAAARLGAKLASRTRAKVASKSTRMPRWLPSMTDTVRPALPPAQNTLIEKLVNVHQVAQALHSNGRPADPVLCAAWLAAMGLSTYVDTNHPYREGEVLKGTVSFPGAKKLRVTLHPRCSTIKGATLVLQAGAKTIGPYEGVVEAVGGKPWASSSVDVAGSTLTYEFKAPPGDKNSDGLWGVAFTVTAVDMPSGRKSALVKKSGPAISHAVRPLATMWTSSMDGELNDLARRIAEHDSTQSTDLQLDRICVASARDAMKFQLIADVPVPQIRLRFALLQQFNTALAGAMSCFEFNAVRPWSTGYLLHSVGHAIFLDVKMNLLNSALESTTGSGGVSTVRLNNLTASASAARGDVDPESSQCIFVQAFQSLRSAPAKALRNTTDRDQAKVFEVKFVGEDGIDAGGVYREGLQRMVEDLFSDRFNLLVPCPNASRHSGENMGSFLPNPKHAGNPEALAMLEFAGRLAGISLRFKGSLPFLFPSLVWKPIVGDALTHADLEAVDDLYAQYLHAIAHCDKDFTLEGEPHDPILDDAAFAEAFPGQYFTTNNTNGEEVELLPGGSSMPVTFSNRLRFCELVTQFRLHEVDPLVAAIKRGMAAIVPIRVLALFTWSELDVLVAGRPEIDIELLKRHTKYDGFSGPSDACIKRFWAVLESMTDDERSGYVRFAWGRSRLPVGERRWTNTHTLQRRGSDDRSLPVAHTCFFSVELPAYSTEERMRWGLNIACNFSGGILSG